MARTGSAIAVALLLSAASALAEVEVSVSPDHSTVGSDTPFMLEITVTGAPEGTVIQAPSAPDFELVGRRNTTETQLTGIPASRIQRTSFALKPRRAGHFVIPPATVLAWGTTYHSKSGVEVDVMKSDLVLHARKPSPMQFVLLPEPVRESADGGSSLNEKDAQTIGKPSSPFRGGVQ